MTKMVKNILWTTTMTVFVVGLFFFFNHTKAEQDNSLNTGLVSSWKFENPNNLGEDSTGNNNLTNHNYTTSITGKSGNGAHFAAESSQYLSIHDNTSLSTGNTDFTISAWVSLDSKNTYRGIATKWSTIDNQKEYNVYYNPSSDKFVFSVSSNGQDSATVSASPVGAISTNNWYLVAAWHDGVNNTINIQINDGAINSISYSLGVFDSSANFQIGAKQTGLEDHMDGRIDEVKFWKRTLSNTERSKLYNSRGGLISSWKMNGLNALATADSAGNNNLINNKGVSFTPGKIKDGASFTSSNSQFLSSPDNESLSPVDSDLTITAWVNLNSKTSYKDIVAKWDASSNKREYILYYDKDNNKFAFAISGNGIGLNRIFASSLGPPSVNKWYFITSWYDSRKHSLNIQVNNGVIDSIPYDGTIFDTDTSLRIGGRQSGLSGYMDGKIDSVTLWKKVLSTDERTALYNLSNGIEISNDFIDLIPPSPSEKSISVMKPTPYQIIQRNGEGKADILISGKYTGTPSSIEASWNGKDYTVISNSPSGGNFSGILPEQNAGQGSLSVRFVDNKSISSSVNYVGIGDIFVIAGQSNASGLGFNSQPFYHSVLKASLFGNNDKWNILTDPVDSTVGQIDKISADFNAGGTVWPSIATKFLSEQNVPVAFIPTALGGTSISKWQRDNLNPGNTNTLYGSMYRRINKVGKVKAVLFWQGEQDAAINMTQNDYKNLLTTMANDIYNDFGVKTIVAEIGDRSAGGALNNVRLAQQSAWDEGVNVLPGPVLYDVNLSDEGGDELHFKSDADIQIAAERWWEAISSDLYVGITGRGPRIISAVSNATKNKILVTFSSSSLPLLPISGITGFTAYNNNSKMTISNIQATANNQLTINLTSPASGALSISLGEDRTGTGKTVPTDSSQYHLPAEIFVKYPVQIGF